MKKTKTKIRGKLVDLTPNQQALVNSIDVDSFLKEEQLGNRNRKKDVFDLGQLDMKKLILEHPHLIREFGRVVVKNKKKKK